MVLVLDSYKERKFTTGKKKKKNKNNNNNINKKNNMYKKNKNTNKTATNSDYRWTGPFSFQGWRVRVKNKIHISSVKEP